MKEDRMMEVDIKKLAAHFDQQVRGYRMDGYNAYYEWSAIILDWLESEYKFETKLNELITEKETKND